MEVFIATLLLWLPAFSFSITIVHLDAKNGHDDVTCGNITFPCRSLYKAWSNTLGSNNVSGDIQFFLKCGHYAVDAPQHQSLSHRCSPQFVNSLEIKLDDKARIQDNDVCRQAQIDYSFDVNSCDFSFHGLYLHGSIMSVVDSSVSFHNCVVGDNDYTFNLIKSDVLWSDIVFKNSSGTISILRSQNTTFKDCHFHQILQHRKPFLDLDGIKSLFLYDTEINDSLGFTSQNNISTPFLVIQNTDYVKMRNFSMKQNNNLLTHILRIKQITGSMLKITDNNNTSLKFINAKNLNLSEVVISRNARTQVGAWNSVISFDGGKVLLKGVQLSCDSFKKRKNFGSPVYTSSTTTFQCVDCKMKNCKKLCGEGLELIDEILCKKCQLGTSAHVWERKCKKCRYGHYSPNFGASDCISCPAGTYCDRLGCANCMKCNNDLFTSGLGSSSCTQMNLFFKILLGCIILLVMGPIAFLMIRKRNKDDEVECLVVQDDKETLREAKKKAEGTRTTKTTPSIN